MFSIQRTIRSFLFLGLIMSPVFYLAANILSTAREELIYQADNSLNSSAILDQQMAAPLVPFNSSRVPANVQPADLEATTLEQEFDILPIDEETRNEAIDEDATSWSLPEKFLPELKMNEWITQSYQEERKVQGQTLKMTILIDVRKVPARGQMTALQFRQPRLFVEGQVTAISFRDLDLLLNSQMLSAIQAYHDLNAVVPESELVTLGDGDSGPVVIVNLNEDMNFLSLKISGLDVVGHAADTRLAEFRETNESR